MNEWTLLLLILATSFSTLETVDTEGDASLRLACLLGKRREAECPLDGGWGAWSSWGPCQGRCGAVGRRSRARTCDNPAPERRGAPCAGPDRQTDTCQLPGCPAEAYEALVVGDELRAQQLELVKVVHARFPALASKCFVDVCRWELVERVLKAGAASYWIALHCVKHNVGCPVQGGWAPWSAWSSCSANCGGGNRTRRRECAAPLPAAPSLACEGTSFELRKCRAVACAETLDGHWAEWGAWSECSAPCGDGIKRRERRCLPGRQERRSARHSRPPISSAGSAAAREMARKLARSVDAENRCPGPGFELAPCQPGPCDVDGGWSDWEEWTACSASCGLGAQARSRSCSRPVQSGDGRPCAGAVTETRRCFRQPCSTVRHTIALFSGGTRLDFEAPDAAHALLHLHVRFLARRPSGQLAHRHASSSDVTLRLAGAWIVLAVDVAGCAGVVVSREPIELHEWHEVMATVTGGRISLRVDDASEHLVAQLSCVPARPRLDSAMTVGRDFHGLVQTLAVNFQTLALQRDCQSGEPMEKGRVPTASSNAQVERLPRDLDEGFRRLRKGDLLAAPCPESMGPWKVELSLRVDSDGLILLLPGDRVGVHVTVTLVNGRVALACAKQAPVQADAQVSRGDWILVTVDRKGVSKGRECHSGPCDLGMRINGGERVALVGPHACVGEMFVGATPTSLQPNEGECSLALEPLEALLGALEMDDSPRDLLALPIAQLAGRQLSSHALCTAASYVEVAAGPDSAVNLSAAYERPSNGAHHSRAATAYWLRLDTVLNGSNPREEGVSVRDDGRATRLRVETSACGDHVDGFYLVWVERCSGDSVIAAFGVTMVTDDWPGAVGAPFLLLGAVALLLCVLYLLMCIVCCCCPPPLEDDCACVLPECPVATPCLAAQPRPPRQPSLATTRTRDSSCSSSGDSARAAAYRRRVLCTLPQRGQPALACLPPGALLADDHCTCSPRERSDSQPSLPPTPSATLRHQTQFDGSDIQCEMTWSDPECRAPLPTAGVRLQAPGTVTLFVDGQRCVYSE